MRSSPYHMFYNQSKNIHQWKVCNTLYFSRVYFWYFFLILCSFMVVRGLGFWIFDWAFGVRYSDEWVWGLWCLAFWAFFGLVSLHKHRRITLSFFSHNTLFCAVPAENEHRITVSWLNQYPFLNGSLNETVLWYMSGLDLDNHSNYFDMSDPAENPGRTCKFQRW